MGVKGANEVLTNLRQLEAKKRNARRKALTRIGLKVKADSISLTPVDTGNLRQSAYTEVDRDVKVTIGYTAAYAPFVHEAMEKLRGAPRTSGTGKGFYWDGGENKFLDKAVKRNAKFIMDELAKAMKV